MRFFELFASQRVVSVGFVSSVWSRRMVAAAGLAAAAMFGPGAGTALAQGPHKTAAVASPAEAEAPVAASPHPASRLAGRYFVDFRARTAASYGHAFVWYGRLNAQGRVGLVDVAGLHPASDSPIPYVIGHVFPVPSETGKSYGDLDEEYLTANYRVYLSEADAKRVFAYIRHMQESSPIWIAGVYNCTAFLADIANYMGLKTPTGATWMYPEDMVNKLKELNGGRQEVSLAAESHGFELSDLSTMFGQGGPVTQKK